MIQKVVLSVTGGLITGIIFGIGTGIAIGAGAHNQLAGIGWGIVLGLVGMVVITATVLYWLPDSITDPTPPRRD